jgi:prevent-host-death family protein
MRWRGPVVARELKVWQTNVEMHGPAWVTNALAFVQGLDWSANWSYAEGMRNMRAWPVQDAKAKFSELLDRCIDEGPQLVTRRGEEAAVLVPIEEWRRLARATRPSLKELLLSDEVRTEIPIPVRGRLHRRSSRAE